MATLVQADLVWCVDWIRNHPSHKTTLKLSGLSKTQLYAALQAVETYSVDSYTSIPTTSLRTAINNATGTTPTTAQNQAIWYAWAAWKGKI